MAECPSSAEQALEKLNEQLTCPICLDQYTDPKLLHCFHVFCEKCLKPVARQTPQGQVVECPNCRHLTSLSQEGVSGLQEAFLIHHLFDIQDILKKVSTPAGTKCVKCEKRDPTCYCRSCGFLCTKCKDVHSEWKEFSSHELVSLNQLTKDATKLVPRVQKTRSCSKHPTKELDIYCETCKEVICHYCVLKVHRDHQYDLATDVFLQQKKVLVSSVEPVEQQLVSVNKALEDLKSLSGEITSQRQDLETKIRAEIRLGHQALEAREEVLISQLDQRTREKLKNVAAQQDQLELVATRLKSCCEFLQESLKTGSQVEILAMGKPFMHQVQGVMSSFKPEYLVLGERADLNFFNSESEFSRICEEFGEVYAYNSKLLADGTGLKLAVVGELATARVKLVDQREREYEGSIEVSCELVLNDGSSRIKGEAKKVGDSQYKISYLPQHRGPHYLHIRVGDKHISGSPFPLSVITTTPTNIITGVFRPWGVALGSERLLVADYANNCFKTFSGKGKIITGLGFGSELLKQPRGLAVSATGNILVCDSGNNCIRVFTSEGEPLKCVGTHGKGPMQFNQPRGIAVHPHSKKIYVAEGANHRVQILNEDFTFCSTFGSKGTDNGKFQRPRYISIDNTGNVYVADSENHRVQIFTENGKYIRQFGTKGVGNGELCIPRGIAIDSNGIVYVNESSNDRISIFTREGEFLRSFGTKGKGPGQFLCPIGITISRKGLIYICDFANGRIQVF